MASNIQLLGSILIGALILLAILNLNTSLQYKSYEYILKNRVQSTTAAAAAIIDVDFQKIGYNVPEDVNIVNFFNSTSIQFLADIDNDNDTETITYWIAGYNEESLNPNDLLLFRQIDDGPQVNLAPGLTYFRLIYRDTFGNVTANIGSIACIEIRLKVESISPYKVDSSYNYVENYWQTKISPPNLL